MSAKHHYIANMTFLSRIERTGARTHANIETKTRLYFQPPERLSSVLKVNFSKLNVVARHWYALVDNIFFILIIRSLPLYLYHLYGRKGHFSIDFGQASNICGQKQSCLPKRNCNSDDDKVTSSVNRFNLSCRLFLKVCITH